MKSISVKSIYAAWAAMAAAMAFLIPALMADRRFFIGFGVSLAVYAFITFRYLRCPHCGRIDNLNQRTYAIGHPCCCRFCGGKITVSK